MADHRSIIGRSSVEDKDAKAMAMPRAWDAHPMPFHGLMKPFPSSSQALPKPLQGLGKALPSPSTWGREKRQLMATHEDAGNLPEIRPERRSYTRANQWANGGANQRADINERSSSTREGFKQMKNSNHCSLPLRVGVADFLNLSFRKHPFSRCRFSFFVIRST